jgi:hypothetical protein
MFMTNKHCVFVMSVEVQYITELRNWMARSLKCVNKNGRAIFNSGEREFCVRQRNQNGSFWGRAAIRLN